ncbi:unnamed protein product, partial [Prorocentrum cordatum]
RPPGLAALAQREAARAPPAGELRGPRLDALLQGIPTPLRLGQRAAALAAVQALEPPADGSAAGVREEAMPAVADPGAAADIPPPVRDSTRPPRRRRADPNGCACAVTHIFSFCTCATMYVRVAYSISAKKSWDRGASA